MIAVNELIDQAYTEVGMTGVGETTIGDLQKVGVNQLNRLITQLNGQGYLSMAQQWADAPAARIVYFRKLATGETPDSPTVDMEPPMKIDGVARKIGDHYIPLQASNHEQMAMKNTGTVAYSWTYDKFREDGPGGPRIVGRLTLDGNPLNSIRVWYLSKLPAYKLEDTVYFPDEYNELLLSGLTVMLADFHELSAEKKESCNTAFTTAKNLIKRANITQRMLRCGTVGSSYRDAYTNGLYGVGM